MLFYQIESQGLIFFHFVLYKLLGLDQKNAFTEFNQSFYDIKVNTDQ